MIKKTPILLFSLLAGLSGAVAAAEMDHSGHDMGSHRHIGNEPIGVMGAHAHEQGDWMFSYRYMRMEMDGNRDGTDRVSTDEVLADYMIAPESMTMEMHMRGAMYGVNDNITVMAMLPYVRKDMDHVTRMGGEFTTRTSGLGDIKLSGLFNINRWGMHELEVLCTQR